MGNFNSEANKDRIDILISRYGWTRPGIETASMSDFKCALCGFDFLESIRCYYSWNHIFIDTEETESIACCTVCKNLLGAHKSEERQRDRMIVELRGYVESKLQVKMREVLEVRKILNE